MASAGGIASVIANGALAGAVRAVALGEPVGTRFAADQRPVSAYKLWLRYGKPATGRIDVDAGAQHALAEDGASLLPVGVTGVHGRFEAGDGVEIAGPDGRVFAKASPGSAPPTSAGCSASGAAHRPCTATSSWCSASHSGLSGRPRAGILQSMAVRTFDDLAARGREAARVLRGLDTGSKDAALQADRRGARADRDAIIAANAHDVADAVASGTSSALVDRLTLDAPRLEALADAARAVAALPDPVARWSTAAAPQRARDHALRVPLGRVLVVYEARPNVTVDVACLCVKSGNVAVLRGSSSARHTNARCSRRCARACAPRGCRRTPCELAPTREELARFVGDAEGGRRRGAARRRGAEALPARARPHPGAGGGRRRLPRVRRRDGRPGDGDLDRGQRQDAAPRRVQRDGDAAGARRPPTLLPDLLGALADRGVELRGCERTRAAAPALEIAPPTTPTGPPSTSTSMLAVRVVDSVDDAIEHIDRWAPATPRPSSRTPSRRPRLRARRRLGLRLRQRLHPLHRRRRVRHGRRDRHLDVAPARPRPDRARRPHDDEVRRARQRPGPRLDPGEVALGVALEALLAAGAAERVRLAAVLDARPAGARRLHHAADRVDQRVHQRRRRRLTRPTRARRRATISARIDSATSPGVRAPMSSPAGVCTRPRLDAQSRRLELASTAAARCGWRRARRTARRPQRRGARASSSRAVGGDHDRGGVGGDRRSPPRSPRRSPGGAPSVGQRAGDRRVAEHTHQRAPAAPAPGRSRACRRTGTGCPTVTHPARPTLGVRLGA